VLSNHPVFSKFNYVWGKDIPAIDLFLPSSHKFVKLISLDGYHADLESIPKINLQEWLYITCICTPRTIPWNVIQPAAKGLEPRPKKWWWRHSFVRNDTIFDAKWIETSYNKTNLICTLISITKDKRQRYKNDRLMATRNSVRVKSTKQPVQRKDILQKD